MHNNWLVIKDHSWPEIVFSYINLSPQPFLSCSRSAQANKIGRAPAELEETLNCNDQNNYLIAVVVVTMKQEYRSRESMK